jgi:site-specific DNA recombinase
MRAAVYARVSTDRQNRDQTIDSQLAALRQWAERHGHDLRPEHVFTDDGYTGSRLDRPALDRLRDAAREGEFDVVAVYSPDRLARRYAYQVVLLEELRKAGCAVAFVHRPITDDPHDQLLLQIQGAVAEYERAVLGERFRRGKLQKARAGHWIAGKAPYGYRYVPKRDGVPGHLVVDEAEAAVVRMLYRWLIDERMTVRQILKRLAAGPWRPRSGKRLWSSAVVHRVLSDPVYTGTGYANRHVFVAPRKPRTAGPRSGERTCRKPRPVAEWIAIPAPAIIDDATRRQAADQLARNSVLSFRRNTRHHYLLRCLLTCRSCGLAMYGITRRNKTGSPAQRYYTCHGKDCVTRDRDHRCPQTPARVGELDAAVWDHIRKLLDDPATLLAQFEAFAGATAGPPGEADQTAAQLRRLDREEQRLVDAYQAEAVSLDELRDRRARIAGRREALRAQREQHERLRAERHAARAVWSDLTTFCDRIRARLGEATLAEQQQVLQLLVDRVIVGEDSLEIRHVIPLRGPQPGGGGQGPPTDPGEDGEGRERSSRDPGVRLRSDGVRPAPLQVAEPPVHLGPVAVDDAGEVGAEQAVEHVGRPAGAAGEQGERVGHERPHPRLGRPLLGRRLVDVQHALRGQFGGQVVVARLHGLGAAVLQQHHPGGAGRLVQDHAKELGGPPFRLAEAGHEQAAEGHESRTRLSGRHTCRQLAAGGAPARADEAMPLVFGDDGSDLGEFPHLVPQRLEVNAVERSPAPTASVGHTRHHRLAVPDRDQCPLVLLVPRLPAATPLRLGLRRDRFGVRVGGRRRHGRVGRVLVQAGLEVGDFGFERGHAGGEPVHESQDGGRRRGEVFSGSSWPRCRRSTP